MIHTSAQFARDLGEGKTVLYATAELTLKDGTEIQCDKDDFVQSGNSYVCSADSADLPLGKAIQKTMKLCLLNDRQKFDTVLFENATAIVYANADLTTGDTEPIKLGKFNVVSSSVDNYIINLSLVDDMLLAEQPFTTNLTFPTTPSALLPEICNNCGILLGDITFQNDDVTLLEKPTKGTCREIIAAIALVAGGIAILDADNYLRIKTYDTDIEYIGDDKVWVNEWRRYSGDLFKGDESVTRYGTYFEDMEVHIQGTSDITSSSAIFISDPLPFNPDPHYGTDYGERRDYNSMHGYVIVELDGMQSYRCDVSSLYVSSPTTFNCNTSFDYRIAKTIYDDNGNWIFTVNYAGIIASRHIPDNCIGIIIKFNSSYINNYNLQSVSVNSDLLISDRDDWFGFVYNFGGNFKYDGVHEDEIIDSGNFSDVVDYNVLSTPISMKYNQDLVGYIRVNVTYTRNGVKTTETFITTSIGNRSIVHLYNYDIDISSSPFINTNLDQAGINTTREGLRTFATAIKNVVNLIRFTPFSGSFVSYPYAELLDICYFNSGTRVDLYSYISDIKFAFNGITNLNNNTKPQSKTDISTSSSIATIAASIANVSREVNPYETQIAHLNELANSALPYYKTFEVTGNSVIEYLHNNIELSNSTIVYKICQEGIFLSHDGGTNWISGIDKNGNLVCYTLSAGSLMITNLSAVDLYLKEHSSPIGTIKYNGSSSSTASLANTTSLTKLVDLTTLEPGVWVINARIQFPGNGTGTRGGAIYSNSSQQGTSYVAGPGSSAGLISFSMSAIVNSTSEMDIDLYARQNSGSAMTVTYYWKAVRIQ